MKRLFLFVLVFTANPAHADIYRCVAADGSTTFSQTPCSETAERVAVESGPAADPGKRGCKALTEANAVLENGCRETSSAATASPRVKAFEARDDKNRERVQAEADRRKKQIEKMQADQEKRRRIQQCRQKIQSEISQIEARIYAGADPNGQRRELQRLRKKMQQCR